MRIMTGLSLLLVCLWGGLSPCRAGEEKGKKSYAFPYLKVDQTQKEVRLEAQLSPALRGTFAALEFLLISGYENQKSKEWVWDRDYESVFVTKGDPNHIQVALMLAGMQPGMLKKAAPKGFSKDNTEHVKGKKADGEVRDQPAQLIDVFVEWIEGAETKRLRAEYFLFDRETKGRAAKTPFAFTGSFFVTNSEGKRVVAASQSSVIAAVFHDESAILNLPFFAKNAHWNANVGLELNAAHLPPFFRREKTIVEGVTPRKIQVPVSKPVTLVFSPHVAEEGDEEAAEVKRQKAEVKRQK